MQESSLGFRPHPPEFGLSFRNPTKKSHAKDFDTGLGWIGCAREIKDLSDPSLPSPKPLYSP